MPDAHGVRLADGSGASVIEVLLVDDSPLVREGLRQFLDGEDGVHVVGTCADGSELVAAVRRWAPDVVVLDLAMPGLDGFAAATALRAAGSSVPLVALSGQPLGDAVLRARDAGFAGYLEKSQPPADVAAAVRRAATGEAAWSARARRVLDRDERSA